MKVKVNAKLNLSLNVYQKVGERHQISSVAVSVNIFDVVQVTKREDSNVTVSGMDMPLQNNVAYKTAVAFAKTFDTCGVDIIITKGIPMGAGMGGSSADSSAVIYCMCKLFDVDVNSQQIKHLCSSLGDDVYFMLFGGLGCINGGGHNVDFFHQHTPCYFALTLFDQSCSTAQVYSQFDKVSSKDIYADNGKLTYLLTRGYNEQALECCNNFLQYATTTLTNYAQDYLQFCKQHLLRTNMTGSGSAYYVGCTSVEQAQQVCNLLNENGFNTVVCQSVPCGIEEL